MEVISIATFVIAVQRSAFAVNVDGDVFFQFFHIKMSSAYCITMGDYPGDKFRFVFHSRWKRQQNFFFINYAPFVFACCRWAIRNEYIRIPSVELFFENGSVYVFK